MLAGVQQRSKNEGTLSWPCDLQRYKLEFCSVPERGYLRQLPLHSQVEKQPQMVIAESVKSSTQSLIAEQSLKRSQNYLVKRQESTASKKYELTKWKFADLRDTINTSCGRWWQGDSYRFWS